MKHSVFDCENNFYLNCDNRRLSKLLIHYELLKKTLGVDGCIVECGVFKGTTFVNLCSMRNVIGIGYKKIIGFDLFDNFEYNYENKEDEELYNLFIKQAGKKSISVEELERILYNKNIHNYKLVKGNILETMERHMEAAGPVSFTNIDVDLYEPTKKSIECLYPKLSKGGIMMLDDYGVFPGATRAADEYFGSDLKIHRFSFRDTPVYIVKE